MHPHLAGEGAEQRLGRAGINRHFLSRERDHGQGIGEGFSQPDIAAGNRDRLHVQLGRGQGQQQGDRVIGAGIAIDDHRARVHSAGPQ
jgi:hypothetical protein